MRGGTGVPWRPLGVLSVLVVAGHLLLLTARPATPPWTPASPAPIGVVLVRAEAAVATGAPPGISGEARRPPDTATPPRRTTAAPSIRTATEGPTPPATDSAPTATAAAAPTLPAGPALPPLAFPAPARWHYTVTALHRGALVTGRAELAWWQDGERYEATLRLDAPPLPARVQRSTGLLMPQGLAPLRFSERLRGEEAAHFDRAAGRIVFSRQAQPAPLSPGAQDRLSVLLQLGALLAARPHGPSPGDALRLQTATARDAQDWLFTVEGQETLAVPGAATAGLKLTRAPRGEWDPRLELWLVPGGDYGPVRLRLTAPNGEWLELQWSGTDKG